jgi:hypothetical protein
MRRFPLFSFLHIGGDQQQDQGQPGGALRPDADCNPLLSSERSFDFDSSGELSVLWVTLQRVYKGGVAGSHVCWADRHCWISQRKVNVRL